MSNLKIGDKVVMNDRYYDERKGEVFTIKAGPEIIGRTECFWLDGYSGAYCADGLDLYKPPTNEEWFCQLSTEEKVKALLNLHEKIRQRMRADIGGENSFYKGNYFREWLKEKHNDNS